MLQILKVAVKHPNGSLDQMPKRSVQCILAVQCHRYSAKIIKIRLLRIKFSAFSTFHFDIKLKLHMCFPLMTRRKEKSNMYCSKLQQWCMQKSEHGHHKSICETSYCSSGRCAQAAWLIQETSPFQMPRKRLIKTAYTLTKTLKQSLVHIHKQTQRVFSFHFHL